jgi:hypothetical protein
MSLTIEMDLRSTIGEARDQGRSRPTCMAFAVSAAHEASRASTDYLSPEFLFYSGAKRSHGDPKRGLTQTAVAEAISNDGQPVEEAWPYSQTLPDIASWKPPPNCDPVFKVSVTFASRTLAEVRALIRSGAPALLLMTLTTAMYVPDAEGIVRSGAVDKVTTNRHALLAVGSAHDGSGEYLLVRNSWGLGWGMQGHAWFHDSCFGGRLHAVGVIS